MIRYKVDWGIKDASVVLCGEPYVMKPGGCGARRYPLYSGHARRAGVCAGRAYPGEGRRTCSSDPRAQHRSCTCPTFGQAFILPIFSEFSSLWILPTLNDLRSVQFLVNLKNIFLRILKKNSCKHDYKTSFWIRFITRWNHCYWERNVCLNIQICKCVVTN